MASNDSPAFDVLSADEYDLWEWAVKRAGAENAATYIREATVKALRAPRPVENLRLAFVRGAEWANGEPFPNPRGVEMEAAARYPDPASRATPAGEPT